MTFAWVLFGIYLLLTAWIGWQGQKKTRDFSSFALGNKDIHPVFVGITLAASVASAATFIINPGFIYVDGFSAWFHMVVGIGLGFIAMLYFLSFQFRRIGDENKALTIPDWIGKRYQSRGFALFFAVLNLLSFAFVVLLVGGISIVMQSLLGISNSNALLITLIFVTGYVFIGGTYAHIFTNVLQGTLMIGVTVLVLVSCVTILNDSPDSFIDRINAINPDLISLVNTNGRLFNDVFSIYIAGFIIGAVLVCQPHILTKALYVKNDKQVKQYLSVFTILWILFLLLGSVGFFAHLVLPDGALVDATTGAFRQDLVMTAYLEHMFPGWVHTLASVILIAAAMSTLDGLLISISTITANDLVLNLYATKQNLDQQAKMKLALRTSHVVLILIAVAAYLINLNPPQLLGIFGQIGVYGLTVAAAPALIFGVMYKNPPLNYTWWASIIALITHFGLYFYGAQLIPATIISFVNPGVTAAIAIIISIVPLLLIAKLKWKKIN
ncbi:MAG: sodium:solute symporter family protein [Alcanivoracaceae bacterium]|nr:sodium:solute symporter family protein [Alcanivoracaceae bacterium]